MTNHASLEPSDRHGDRPPLPSLEQFVEHLTRSGLVPVAVIHRVRRELDLNSAPDASLRLAQGLIRSGDLTPYQANKLLNGHTRGFFLGGYRILSRLGEGGMGKVYLAQPPEGTGRVAVKVLPPRKAAEDGQTLSRFLREIRVSQQLDHPNVARTIGAGCDGGVNYMVMEYVPGQSLQQLVTGRHGQGPLSVPEAARIFLGAIDGLAAAHKAGLVHRDVKPSNLMMTPDGQVKLLDLGLARDLDEETPLTRHNTILGTLDYASPEQLVDATQVDARSDLYSLGCTLYFTLTGRPPFAGGDMVNKIFKQRLDDPELIERVAPQVPPEFGAIVRKLMAKEPAERYQSCAELRADLARWTDPRCVQIDPKRGSRARTAARSQIDDEDFRFFRESIEASPGSLLELVRETSGAEPTRAPLRKPPPPPRAAILRDPRADLPAVRQSIWTQLFDPTRWLLLWTLGMVALGILAILLIWLVR